jgi:hypothetical protein
MLSVNVHEVKRGEDPSQARTIPCTYVCGSACKTQEEHLSFSVRERGIIIPISIV